MACVGWLTNNGGSTVLSVRPPTNS
jgi:hypothetical protein